MDFQNAQLGQELTTYINPQLPKTQLTIINSEAAQKYWRYRHLKRMGFGEHTPWLHATVISGIIISLFQYHAAY